MTMLADRHILLVIGGGIAAYKSLDLIRRLKERGASVRCILTAAAQEFVTPLAAGALSSERVFTDLFDPASEFDVGHIRLAREADVVVVAPATADLMAKMAGGHADDLATAVLLATDRPVLIAPAMNSRMWGHAAMRRNAAQLAADGVVAVGPNTGEMAESGVPDIDPAQHRLMIHGLVKQPLIFTMAALARFPMKPRLLRRVLRQQRPQYRESKTAAGHRRGDTRPGELQRNGPASRLRCCSTRPAWSRGRTGYWRRARMRSP